MADTGEESTITEEKEKDVFSDFVQSFAKPISKSDPCGESVRYDEDFEKIKTEIDKLSEIDFQLIADLSSDLLTEKTKDVLVGSYLAFALTKNDGISGFAEGIGALSVITENFWEDLFPQRVVARKNAFTFFVQKVSSTLDTYKPTEQERPTVARAIERFDQFQEFIIESMGEHAPAFSGLKRVLSDLERRLPKPKAETPAAAPSAPTGDSTTAASPASASASTASPPAAAPPADIQSNSDASRAVTKACTFLRTSEPTNPAPYRVMRALRWGIIVQAPPHEAGKTKVPVPVEQRRTYLESLLQKNDTKQLLPEAEMSFQEGSFHFWLDLQRLISVAMEQLGTEYQNARQAVLEETAFLVQRVPEILELSYSDGTPFASALTVDWIQSDVQSLLSAGGAPETLKAGAQGSDADLASQKKEAMSALNKGDLSGAITLMRKGGEKDRSAKDKFLRQLILADLCMKGKRPSVARTILENLDGSIEEHGLAVWEPDLALEAWSALHACYRALEAKAPPAEKAAVAKNGNDIFDKICRIDAAYALTLPNS